MNDNILDYIDFNRTDDLFCDFNKISGVGTSILDLEGNILSKSCWKTICTAFHRTNCETNKNCKESDKKLQEFCKKNDYNVYKCKNGLYDVAVPIYIDKKHLANLFVGPFFYEKPDIELFRKKALKYNFSEDAYLDSLKDVPVYNDEQISNIIKYLLNIIKVIIDLTTEKTEQKNSKICLEASLESPLDTVVFAIDNNYKYLYFNKAHKKTLYDLYGTDIHVGDNHLNKITNAFDYNRAKENTDKVLAGEALTLIQEWGAEDKVYYETNYYPMFGLDDEIIGVSIFAKDITQKIHENQQLKDSEEKYRLLYSSMSQGLGMYETVPECKDHPRTYLITDVNDSYTKLFNISREEVVGKTIHEVNPDVESIWIDSFFEVAETRVPKYVENFSAQTNKYYSAYIYSFKKGHCAVLFSDITERLEKEKEIKYLSYYDQLTDIYNRRYYEQQMIALDIPDNLPLSLIMGDVNGLKLVNDSFGHKMGDELLKKVADILKTACRNTDIVSRIGGDEFVIILPKTDKEKSNEIIKRIKSLLLKENINGLNVSVSFGNATKTKPSEKLDEVFKAIEDDMYRKKLNEGASMRSNTIDLIMTTLFEKNEREMVHSKRVSKLSEELAIALDFAKEDVDQIKNAGLMHDIGKIAIPEAILNKKGKLDIYEWTEVKRHCEVGYRILSSLNEFSEIADFILGHHERWDGKGYPKGLVGKENPIQSRIINIADAYDAMTGTRTYKKALTKEEAIAEIERCTGTQFDPEIAKVFINKVLKKNI